MIDLEDVVRHAATSATPMVEGRGHVLTVSVPKDRVLVRADSTRIEEVVVNLLNNAAKYTKDGGRIDVALAVEDGRAVLRVRDTGVGIEPELLPRVFDIFSQGRRSLDRAEGGLGIGLCLVQRLVEMHGGDVEAHSEGLGKGSEFVVRLPVVSVDEPAEEAEGSAGKLRVLVVDDNKDACLTLARLLRMTGFGVQTSFTGPAALRAVQAWRPDVVLLDIGLPEIDGYELARRLRRDYPRDGIFLVAVTGYGAARDVEAAKAAGFDEHLLKPVDFTALEALLSTRRARDLVH